MNRLQKLSIWLGAVTILIMSLFPPWLLRDKERVRSIGYHSIAAPLDEYKIEFTKGLTDTWEWKLDREEVAALSKGVEAGVNWRLLALQCAVAVVAALSLFIATREGRGRSQ